MEKAGDLWARHKRLDGGPITCTLGQLKLLVMEDGAIMGIHSDDFQNGVINFNRNHRRLDNSIPQTRNTACGRVPRHLQAQPQREGDRCQGKSEDHEDR